MSLAPLPPLRAALLAGALLVAGTPPGAAAQEASPTATYRTSLMEALRAHTGALRAVLDDGAPFQSDIAAHAAATHQAARMVEHAFPEGSGGEATRSRDEIWENPAGFADRMAAFRAAADALDRAAAVGDVAGTGEALAEVGRSCTGCHRDFRKPAR